MSDAPESQVDEPRVDDPGSSAAFADATPPPEGGVVDASAEEPVMSEFEVLTAERDSYYDQLLRTRADFDNFRKRMIKQQTEHLERANEILIVKLLDVLDVLDGAKAHGEGFEQVGARLAVVLEKEGLERIDPFGREFDPNEADAVAHEPNSQDDAGEAQVVSAVLRPGYRWKGRVVRPAMVKVRG